MADTLISLLETPEPAHLTMQKRAGTMSIDAVNAAVAKILGPTEMPRLAKEAARAAVLLWHDHFDAAHEIAQDIENSDGALLHGIIHRREPDYANARYWFRRVGPHPSFECVVGKIKVALLTGAMETEAKQIIPNDKWHPLPFMDFFEHAIKRDEGRYQPVFRQFQRAEIECFLQTLPTR